MTYNIAPPLSKFISLSTINIILLLTPSLYPYPVTSQSTSYTTQPYFNFQYQGIIPPNTPNIPGLYWYNQPYTLSPIIDTQGGAIQGLITNNDTVQTFWGIPYAKPPIGKLRFNDPQPAESWSGIYNATYPKKACIQGTGFKPQDQLIQNFYSDYDCLYMNIYVPNKNSSGTSGGYPVYVFIPGGGGLFTEYQAMDQLVQASQKVIVIYVSIYIYLVLCLMYLR